MLPHPAKANTTRNNAKKFCVLMLFLKLTACVTLNYSRLAHRIFYRTLRSGR